MKTYSIKTTTTIALLISSLCVFSQSVTFPIVLEAEHAQLFGDLKIRPDGNATMSGISGGKYIGDFHASANSRLRFTNVEVPEEGAYQLRIFSMGSGRRLSIKVNQYEKTVETTATSNDWNGPPPATINTLIYMDKGNNTLIFYTHNGEDGPNLDKFEIRTTSEILPRPKIINLVFNSSHTDEAEITAEHENETLPYLTDNSEHTLYRVPDITSTLIVATCKQPILLTAYLLSAGMNATTDVKQWKLESSRNNRDWNTVTPNRTTDLEGAILFEIDRTISNANSQRAQYYRLTATGDTDVEVAEWQLFGVPYIMESQAAVKTFPQDITEGMDIQAKTLGFPSGSTGSEFYNLFDRNLNTLYDAGTTKAYSVEIELDKPYKLTSYTLTSTNAASNRDPKKWTFNGFNEELGWVELDRHTEYVFPSRLATMRFDVDSSIVFSKFLLDVEDNNGGNSSQLLKWQLFGEEQEPDPTSTKIRVDNGCCTVLTEKGKINILAKENAALTYSVYNTVGTLVAKGRMSSELQKIAVPQGIYIVSLIDGVTKQNVKVVVL